MPVVILNQITRAEVIGYIEAMELVRSKKIPLTNEVEQKALLNQCEFLRAFNGVLAVLPDGVIVTVPDLYNHPEYFCFEFEKDGKKVRIANRLVGYVTNLEIMIFEERIEDYGRRTGEEEELHTIVVNSMEDMAALSLEGLRFICTPSHEIRFYWNNFKLKIVIRD